ncbi:hypothetical protein QJS10_CPA16g00459 [Acorus calamus]|uniref:Uncharacterized protein n=1 Tax=Acorus calamus TaxID=4465 RepID=A0AAV9D3E5_ACOCL|nr:hypothetical protein QJS10_CPA16g00459 [Acorus calamus]
MLAEFLVLLGTFDVGDFIPSLDWVSGLNGFNVRVKKCFEEESVLFHKVNREVVQALEQVARLAAQNQVVD